MDCSLQDEKIMRHALDLAMLGEGSVSPNPMVGAVLLDPAGNIIGEGYHHRAGEAHAEIEALRDAQVRGHSPQGCTLYVTLEPCSTVGRTGACVNAILNAKISRVVCATIDPNPKHRGRGIEILKSAGVDVSVGVLAEDADRMNAVFNHWIQTRRPFVTLKSAMSLDGKIATVQGESKWITSEDTRKHAMRYRLKVDAIITGVNTVLADDCALTVRLPGVTKQPRRIILDSLARTPENAQVVSDAVAQNTTIVVTDKAAPEKVSKLSQKVNVWTLPALSDGHVDLSGLLDRLGAEEVTSVLVEAGGTLSGAFVQERLVDRVHFYYAPKVLGGKNAPTGVEGDGMRRLDEVLEFEHCSWIALGQDMFFCGDVIKRADK